MMNNSYMGKLLYVNLSHRKATIKELDTTLSHLFLGGSGLACRLLYSMVDRDTAPFSPENPLIFMTGPLTGTIAPSCGRYVVCSLSPQTNIWGEANSGGFFGPELKFAGFDGLIIHGCASEPMYLMLTENGCEFRSAAGLWGKDTFETQEIIRSDEGDKKVRVACIGQAGENIVKFASVMNDNGRAAGRTGMGAVMGSKKLKAIAVRGEKNVPLANPEKFEQVARETIKFVKDSFVSQMFGELGTSGYVELGQELGDMPNRYYTQGRFEGAEKLSGSAMAASILVGREHCYLCPIGCGRRIEIRSGKYRLPPTAGPEYETVAALGTMLLCDNLEAVAYANYLCNAFGLDTISCGVSIAFAYYLFELKKLSREQTGFELRWGDIDTAIELIKKIARREGFGNLLAEGVRTIGEKYNAVELAAHVNGLEVPMHDPRAFHAQAVCYAVSPRGACHLQGDMYSVDLGSSVPELGIETGDKFASEGRSQTITKVQNYRSLYDAIIMCHFCTPQVQQLQQLLTFATGHEFKSEDLDRIGERIFDLKRVFNIKRGLTARNDRLPELLLRPLTDGGTQGMVPDMNRLMAEYYECKAWDCDTGRPTKHKLEQLGLDELGKELWS